MMLFTANLFTNAHSRYLRTMLDNIRVGCTAMAALCDSPGPEVPFHHATDSNHYPFP